MRKHMLDTLGLRAHKERDAEQHVCCQLAEHEHKSVGQHKPFVVYLLVNVTDGSDAGHQCTRVQNGQQAKQ